MSTRLRGPVRQSKRRWPGMHPSAKAGDFTGLCAQDKNENRMPR